MALAHRTTLSALLALAALGLHGPAVAAPDPVVPAAQSSVEAGVLMAGAIDIHVHSYPDDRPRAADALDVAG